MGIVQVSVPQFIGINQSQGERIGMGYATYAENMDTSDGQLEVANGFTAYAPDLGAPIITLARFHRRFHSVVSERNVLVAATATAIYALVEGVTTPAWQQIYTGAQSGSWDFVTYEDIRDEIPEPVDVLLMSNAKDGMLSVWGDTLTVETIETPAKFGALARYKERIFGTAAEDEPDRIWHSAPFNPKVWELDMELPQNGGGEIDYPTWDGDSFIALRPFGGYLLAFKRNMVCLITGADVGEFNINEGYGTDGPLSENTIVVNGSVAFFLSTSGIGMYDGSTIRVISRDALSGITSRINMAAIHTAIATIDNGIYYCAVPLDAATAPNAVIEYDTVRGAFMLRTGLTVGAMLQGVGSMLVTSRTAPDRPCRWGVGGTYDGAVINAKWVSPWTDLDSKETTKSAFRLRGEFVGNGPIKFSIQTERKTKAKTIVIPAPLDVKKKMVQKSLTNRGRQFRFVLENIDGKAFSVPTGLQIETELDAD